MYICSIYLAIIGFVCNGYSWIKVNADEVTVISINRNVPGKLLTCFKCQHSRTSPNSDCINMKNTTDIDEITCQLHEPFCRVRKLMNDDHIEHIERSCAQQCTPGCEKMTNKVQKCISCCAHRLCNTGNGADDRRLETCTTTILAFLTCISIMTRS